MRRRLREEEDARSRPRSGTCRGVGTPHTSVVAVTPLVERLVLLKGGGGSEFYGKLLDTQGRVECWLLPSDGEG